MNAGTALAVAIARLREAGVPDPARDARRLLEHVAGGTWPGDELPDPQAFGAVIARRAAREPVSHITGRRAFWRHEFRVTRDVLDPRPETEILVEQALDGPARTVCDLGTGSGCVLLSILAERPDAEGTGIDSSRPALAVARENASRLGLASRVRLQLGDWLTGVAGQFDLIVSNPPYVAPRERAGLAPELAWEPEAALVPLGDPGDGLADYRRIIDQAPERLLPGGRLMLELGVGQGGEVVHLMRAAGLEAVRLHPDLDGRERVAAGKKPL